MTQIGDMPQLARLLLSDAQLKRRKDPPAAIDMLHSAATYAQVGDDRGVAVVDVVLAQTYLRQRRWFQSIFLAGPSRQVCLACRNDPPERAGRRA